MDAEFANVKAKRDAAGPEMEAVVFPRAGSNVFRLLAGAYFPARFCAIPAAMGT